MAEETTSNENTERPKMPQIAAGELEPGQAGFLELDDAGLPQGDPTKEPPGTDVPFARVQASPQAVYDEVVTITGAPVTAQMNPSQSGAMDEGFLARNPPPDVLDPLEPTEPIK